MSDHLLIGLAPTSPKGRELFFHSFDTWIELLDVIGVALSDKEPVDTSTPEGTQKLAGYIREVLEDGRAEILFRETAKMAWTGRGCMVERKGYVDRMRWHTEDLIEFLKHSGGVREG